MGVAIMELRGGIDVSKHQGRIDWQAVKETGEVQFAILRAGYGRYTSQKDSQFERNYLCAKAVGIPVGAYWYSYAESVEEAKEEAKACLQVLQGKRFEYPIYFDIEDCVQLILGKAELTEICEAFCDMLEDAGYYAGVYASTYWFTNKLDHARLAANYTIWLADYRKYYDKDLARHMHQYSAKGRVKGIQGRVDLDVCTLNFPAIIKAAGLNGYSKAAAPGSTGLKTFSAQASPGDLAQLEKLAKSLELDYKIE